jgi:cold shock CspA family protein
MASRGTVAYFDRARKFGKIQPTGGGEPIFVHANDLQDPIFRYLVEGEPVEFDLRETEKGLAASNVRRLEDRFSGVTESFSPQKGYGMIVTDDGDVELFVHYNDILSRQGFKKLIEGERVEFSIQKGEGARHRAVRVTADARSPLDKFAVLPGFEGKLQELANLAQPEDWNYKHALSKRPLPILHSFVHYTFRRLEEERKITISKDPKTNQSLACINTGLVTKFHEPLFGAFHENRNLAAESPWVLIGFFKESQHPITSFPAHPEPANYFDDPSELLYDRRRKLVKNINHIIEERLDRFPKRYQDDPRNLPAVLNMAVEQAEKRVARNYKTAIPQFNKGRIQLLLPLCLEDPSRADLALVVGHEAAVYKGYTVLTLDMAYNNARLLTRPDDEWLVP